VPFGAQLHPGAVAAQKVATTEHVLDKLLAKMAIALTGEEMIMVVLPVPYRVNLEKAAEALGARDFRLASEEQFQDTIPDGALSRFLLGRITRVLNAYQGGLRQLLQSRL
jgi:Ala-tRNA(Pro) deacylase